MLLTAEQHSPLRRIRKRPCLRHLLRIQSSWWCQLALWSVLPGLPMLFLRIAEAGGCLPRYCIQWSLSDAYCRAMVAEGELTVVLDSQGCKDFMLLRVGHVLT